VLSGHVCFSSESGHVQCSSERPLSANSGHKRLPHVFGPTTKEWQLGHVDGYTSRFWVKPSDHAMGGVLMQIAGAIRICGALICITALCFVNAATADDSEICVRGSGDAAIDACTRALSSGRYDKRNLAIIYSNRGNQWERKGEFDKALEDHNKAIRTDPT
jgi:hypothetical protein